MGLKEITRPTGHKCMETHSAMKDIISVDLLPERQKITLQLYIQGFSKDEIARRMKVKPDSLKTIIGNAYKTLGVHSELQAAIRFFKPYGPLTGILDILEDSIVDVDKVAGLTKRELDVLEVMTANGGICGSNPKIAETLNCSVKNISTHLIYIFLKLNLTDLRKSRKRVVAGLLYLTHTGVIDKE